MCAGLYGDPPGRLSSTLATSCNPAQFRGSAGQGCCGTAEEGSRRDRHSEIASLRAQVDGIADKVMHLVDLISRQDRSGRDSAAVQDKRAVL
jgi:hypothetical protein